MTIIIGIVIGVLLWNMVTLVYYWITDNESYATMIGAGFWALVVIGIDKLVNKIEWIILKHKYCSVLIDPNGKACYCKPLSLDEENKLCKKGYQWNKTLKEKYSPSDGWDIASCVDKHTINLRYTPIKIAKQESMYKLKI